MFKDVAIYNQQVLGAGHVRALVDAGCRAALSQRGVAHISCPVDLQEQAVKDDKASAKKVEGHTSGVWRPPTVVPCADDIRAAAHVLNAGKRTVILAGQGALGAGAELEQLADLMAAPIVKPLLGKAAVPDDSPFTTGGIGLLGTEPSEIALEQCDTLLMAGTSFRIWSSIRNTTPVAACRSTAIRRGSVCAFRSKWGCAATREARCRS